jgi:hypothetical protein
MHTSSGPAARSVPRWTPAPVLGEGLPRHPDLAQTEQRLSLAAVAENTAVRLGSPPRRNATGSRPGRQRGERLPRHRPVARTLIASATARGLRVPRQSDTSRRFAFRGRVATEDTHDAPVDPPPARRPPAIARTDRRRDRRRDVGPTARRPPSARTATCPWPIRSYCTATPNRQTGRAWRRPALRQAARTSPRRPHLATPPARRHRIGGRIPAPCCLGHRIGARSSTVGQVAGRTAGHGAGSARRGLVSAWDDRPATSRGVPAASQVARSGTLVPGDRDPLGSESKRYLGAVAPRPRVLAFGSAAALVVAGPICAALVSGLTGEVLAIALITLGLGAAVLLMFLEVGLSEERQLAREEKQRRRRATDEERRLRPRRRPRRPG